MLLIKKILVPRDFSPSSDAALRYALGFARRFGAELHTLFAEVLHGELYAPTERTASERDRLRTLLKQTAEGAGAAPPPFDPEGLRMQHAVVRDVAPAPAILAYADAHDVDLIVMGTHGRRGLRRLLLGSVAAEVVRTARCPVLTLHEDQPAAAAGGPRCPSSFTSTGFSTPASRSLPATTSPKDVPPGVPTFRACTSSNVMASCRSAWSASRSFFFIVAFSQSSADTGIVRRPLARVPPAWSAAPGASSIVPERAQTRACQAWIVEVPSTRRVLSAVKL